jgi:HD-GYP domain-containing protein (c-di-GMP phosphodiesterase class II)
MGLDDGAVFWVEMGAFLHDIGKIGVPDAILKKPGALDDAEWKVMRQHSQLGADLLEPIHRLRGARDIVLHHHESWCGRGYPFGLEAEAIPLGARIFSPIDAYDAMTSDRPYRRGMSHGEAVTRLIESAGTQFDPKIVKVILAIEEAEWLAIRDDAQRISDHGATSTPAPARAA